MDTVFPAPPTDFQSAGSFNVTFLRSAVQQAATRAQQFGHAVLASIVLPSALYDPLHVLRTFKQLPPGDSVYWEHPAQQRALVGVGAVTTIETSGPERFATATAAWRALQQDAILAYGPGVTAEQGGGPILLGGFAFDPLAAHTRLWDDFPDGLLILPQLLFHTQKQYATLTLNKLVQADCDTELVVQEMIVLLTSLRVADEYAATLPPIDVAEKHQLAVEDVLPRTTWQEIIAHAVTTIKQGAFAKAVLAREVRVSSEQDEFDVPAVLARLRAAYAQTYVFALQRGARCFVGATPERLVYGQDGQLRTMALAGSIARGATPEEDQRLGTELLQSSKNKWEHAIVVSTIREALADICSHVWVADTPQLLRLKNIQHLETPIVGELLPGHCVLEALHGLHPTPAVGGYPRQPALSYIRDHERLDRGWYAGPVGWIDPAGNGEFAVALRSGLIDGKHATLFGGCGIVADSQPESEYIESCLKLQVMLRGLGGKD